MSGFSLLASYPRSGNTWVRAVLTALARGQCTIDLNAIDGRIIATRAIVDDGLEVETSDLLPDEERRLRPEAYRAGLRPSADGFPLKTHDAWLTAPGATEPPFPSELIDAVVLIVRDPRDVAISFARYFGQSLDEAIGVMAQPTMMLGRSRIGLRPQVSQLVSSWSGHTQSWIDSGLPLTCVRYEDLLATPIESFSAIAARFGFTAVPNQIEAAIDRARFDTLKTAEAHTGFVESSPFAPNRFFGAGIAGGWRTRLTADQAARIAHDHGETMQAFGYTD